MIDPQTELERFFAASTEQVTDLIRRVARSMLDRRMNNEGAIKVLQKQLSEIMTLAHLHGARRVVLEVDKASGGRKWRAAMSDLIPKVPFRQAVEDLVDRIPTWETGQTWQDVARAYQEGPAFAAVRASSLQITERVQKAVSTALDKGQSIGTISGLMQDLDDWSQAYADTVFRTNAATAYSRGRMEEAQRPLVKREMPAFERFSAQDVDVRDNHAAAHGLIAATDDPIWLTSSGGGPAMVPSGYNCRCSLRLVDREELDSRGLLLPDGGVKRYYPPKFGGYYPDPGFEGKFGG